MVEEQDENTAVEAEVEAEVETTEASEAAVETTDASEAEVETTDASEAEVETTDASEAATDVVDDDVVDDDVEVIQLDESEDAATEDGAQEPEASEIETAPSVIDQVLDSSPIPASDALDTTAKPRVDVSHPLAQDIVLNPTKWLIWPAIAVLRWLLRRAAKEARRIVYRSEPTLNFPASEIRDIAVDAEGIELILSAPGIAVAGSALPTSDIARIIADKRRGGALADWLDGIGDRFMHVLETAQRRNNPAFSLSTGGRIEYIALASNLVGQSAPLTAYTGGQLSADRRAMPEGAVGLAALYMGPISAIRLEDLMRAVTELPVKVREFTGAEIPIVWPARAGGRMGRMLGLQCDHPEAGIEIVIEGGSDQQAREWALQPVRRQSLKLLASSFLGSPCPVPTLFLLLNADNVPSAALDGHATLGGLAVLGQPNLPTFIPLV